MNMPVYRFTPHALKRMAQRGVDLSTWLHATQDAEWYEDEKRVKVIICNWNALDGKGKACDLIVVLDHQQTVRSTMGNSVPLHRV